MSATVLPKGSEGGSNSRPVSRFHPLVWPLWLLAGALTIGSNPLHNLLMLLGAALVAIVCQDASPVRHAFGLFVRVGAVVVALRIALSSVAVARFAFGETPLGRLPLIELPWWLGGLALGGSFTLEMIMTGLVGGVQLLTLLALFGAFNAAADHYGLLRRMPAFLGGAGLAVTIALAFVPQTMSQLAALRDAQRARGYRFRNWRDALPLLVPLISGGLERSLQLAEAMASRGYGARPPTIGRRSTVEQLATLVGLVLLSIGLFALFYGPDPRPGLLTLAGSAGILAWVARSMGRGANRSRYLRERWRARDYVVAGGSIMLVAAVILLRRLSPETLVYLPLPRALPPAFTAWSIVLLILLILPATVTAIASRRARPGSSAYAQ